MIIIKADENIPAGNSGIVGEGLDDGVGEVVDAELDGVKVGVCDGKVVLAEGEVWGSITLTQIPGGRLMK